MEGAIAGDCWTPARYCHQQAARSHAQGSIPELRFHEPARCDWDIAEVKCERWLLLSFQVWGPVSAIVLSSTGSSGVSILSHGNATSQLSLGHSCQFGCASKWLKLHRG